MKSGKQVKFEKESQQYYKALMEDIYTMMTYTRETGIALPDSLQNDITILLSSEQNTVLWTSSTNNPEANKP